MYRAVLRKSWPFLLVALLATVSPLVEAREQEGEKTAEKKANGEKPKAPGAGGKASG